MDRVSLAWIALLWLTALAEGLQVTVPDRKKVAMLFQPTLLRCHFSTSSRQPAVVQWKFKSYCQDRMGEALGMASPRAQALSKRNLDWDPYLDCLDSRRTVRVVASKQGSTVTLGDFYRGREVTIVHDADLQIGKLMWGDSGLYYCIITTPDDLEGKNEDSVELLVLGRTGLLADLLPRFAVEIMPEWVFVGLVILGVVLFFVLVGICWCQCCPHSCCCYIRCPCCPDSCCCPQALYEAGKAAKAGYPPSVSCVPGPYSIPSVPLGGAPSSGMLMDKPHPPPLAPSDSTGGSRSVRKGYRIQADKEQDSMKVLYYVEKELARFDPARRLRGRYNNTISELSSLHEEDGNFRQSYHQTRGKQFPGSRDLESSTDYWSGVVGGSGASRGPSAVEYSREDRDGFRHSQQRCKSEMLSRKSFATGVPAVSMDELAAFADSYGSRSRRADNGLDARAGGRFERAESRARGGLFGDGPPEGYPPEGYSPERYFGARSRSREPSADAERAWAPEDAPLPRLVSLPAACEHPSRGGSLETPSRRGAPYYAWSPATYRARAPRGSDEGDAPDDALPPYSEHELTRRPSHRGRDLSAQGTSEKRRKKEPAKKPSDFPTRMSLVV
ncbi:immunoglobulin-like domain-containing receptor 2 isoform 2-T2 [Molossus nigricans]